MTTTETRYKTKTTLLLAIIIIEIIFLVSLAFLCASLGSKAYSEVSFLEVSLDGTALQLEDGRKLKDNWTIPSAIQERFLKTFIQSFRSVSSDEDAVINNIGRVVYRTTGQANQIITSYLEANQPLVLSKDKLVEVPYEDIELTNYGSDTWKIIWREITYSVNDRTKLSDKQYEAVVYLSFNQPKNEGTLQWNPLGIFITYMDSDLLRSYT